MKKNGIQTDFPKYYFFDVKYPESYLYSIVAQNTKFLEESPENPIALNYRGVVFAHLKLYTKAKDDFDKAIKLNSEFAEVYHNRGTIYYVKRDFLKCVDDYNNFLKYHSNSEKNRADLVRKIIKEMGYKPKY
jgi:tetratricopeptide (TPR) repeat protein